MLTVQNTTVARKAVPQTLRQQSCVCGSRICTILFDGRTVISGVNPTQTLPGCWKQGRDVFETRVDRRAAEAEEAMEKAYELLQIGK